VPDDQTCGKGLEQNSVVPVAMAEASARLAANLEVHMRALDRDDPAAAREHDVYERVARTLRSAAADLRAAGDDMAAARDLPMGRHDMGAMTSPAALEAFERSGAAEDALQSLLEERRAWREQMLRAMREAIGGR
jgi:hypothetical protein